MKKTRSTSQNSSLWLWCEQISSTLNDRGLDINSVIEIPIRWNKDRFKAVIVDKMISDMGKSSSTQLTSEDLNDLIDGITRGFAMKGIVIPPFPHIEDKE